MYSPDPSRTDETAAVNCSAFERGPAARIANVAAHACSGDSLPKAVLRDVLVMFLAVSAALIVWSSTSHGQEAGGRQIHPDILKDPARIQRTIRSFSLTKADEISKYTDRDRQMMENYFAAYVPAVLTKKSELTSINATVAHLNDLLTRMWRPNPLPAGGNEVKRWIYGALSPIAKGDFQTPGRINAILCLSRLPRNPATDGGYVRPEPVILRDLLRIYEDDKNPEGVRAAALAGMERFVRLTPKSGIDAKIQGKILDAVEALLNAAPPAGRDPMAHAFMQRYAVDIVTQLSVDKAISQKLLVLSSKDDRPDLIALYLMGAAGTMPGKIELGNVKVDDLLQQWGTRAMGSLDAEIARLEAYEPDMSPVSQPADPRSFVTVRSSAPSGRRGMGEEMSEGMSEGMGERMAPDESSMEDGEGGFGEMGSYGEMGGFGVPGASARVEQPPEIIASRKKLSYLCQQLLLAATGQAKPVDELDPLENPGGLMAAVPADQSEKLNLFVTLVSDFANGVNEGTEASRRDYLLTLQTQRELLSAHVEGKSNDEDAGIRKWDDAFGSPTAAADAPPVTPDPNAAFTDPSN